jgi:hypothetical protein
MKNTIAEAVRKLKLLFGLEKEVVQKTPVLTQYRDARGNVRRVVMMSEIKKG